MGGKLATFILDGPQPSMLPFETNFCQAGSRKLFTTAHASATEMMARKLRYSKPPCTKPSPLCVAFWPVGSHNTMSYLYFSHLYLALHFCKFATGEDQSATETMARKLRYSKPPCTPSPWLTRIWLTRISLTRIFKRFPFLT